MDSPLTAPCIFCGNDRPLEADLCPMCGRGWIDAKLADPETGDEIAQLEATGSEAASAAPETAAHENPAHENPAPENPAPEERPPTAPKPDVGDADPILAADARPKPEQLGFSTEASSGDAEPADDGEPENADSLPPPVRTDSANTGWDDVATAVVARSGPTVPVEHDGDVPPAPHGGPVDQPATEIPDIMTPTAPPDAADPAGPATRPREAPKEATVDHEDEPQTQPGETAPTPAEGAGDAPQAVTPVADEWDIDIPWAEPVAPADAPLPEAQTVVDPEAPQAAQPPESPPAETPPDPRDMADLALEPTPAAAAAPAEQPTIASADAATAPEAARGEGARSRRVQSLVVVGAVVAVIAAWFLILALITRGGDDVVAEPPSSSVTTTPTTSPEPDETAAPTTAAPATTTPATIPQLTAEGEPLAVSELALGAFALGPFDFNTTGALGRLVATFGQPDGIAPTSEEWGTCAGDDGFVVSWGPLDVIFLGPTDDAELVAYRVSADGDHPAASLATLSGFSAGETVADLEATYADFAISFEEVAGTSSFILTRVTDGVTLLWGPVSSSEPDGVVEGVYSPRTCDQGPLPAT